MIADCKIFYSNSDARLLGNTVSFFSELGA